MIANLKLECCKICIEIALLHQANLPIQFKFPRIIQYSTSRRTQYVDVIVYKEGVFMWVCNKEALAPFNNNNNNIVLSEQCIHLVEEAGILNKKRLIRVKWGA